MFLFTHTVTFDPANRYYIIDFVKGFLVVTMVVYHTMNYFLSGYHIIYAYVNYVVQAFIFYSGFMCGTIYLKKFIENKKLVYIRLTTRGIKLILLFFTLNIIIHSLLKRNFNNQDLGLSLLYNNFYDIIFSGNPIARFSILLPIAYLLIISAPLINLFKLRYLTYPLLFISFCIMSVYDIRLSFNVSCVLIGIGGLFTGFISKIVERGLNSKLIKGILLMLLLLYLLILVPHGIDIRNYIVVYFLYINLIIANLYLLYTYLEPNNFITKIIIKFGQYSLLLYLAQIFFLQLTKRILNIRFSSLGIEHFLIFVLINILLVFCCYLTDYLRNKFTFIDKSYQFIFS